MATFESKDKDMITFMKNELDEKVNKKESDNEIIALNCCLSEIHQDDSKNYFA